MSAVERPNYQVGSLVSARGREWVVLPSDDPDVLRLRPLGGTESEATGVFLPLERDDVRAATFALPDPARPGDSVQASLLRDAVRLNFRAGAGPFRSLGRIAVEPRAYQLVPLLMALRLDPVRLLIADDVGIGKTVEALLIARELLDRGEIKRIAVICPPHLCDQWRSEMAEKFGIQAEVVRSGSVNALGRHLTADQSIFEVYPFLVISIDYIKNDRRRDDFVRACAEFVIVDEAHTAAAATGRGAQQQRHSLLQSLAKDPARHIVLTTATPHSGVADAFRSLLTLLSPDFADLPLEEGLQANSPERERLARHLIQRRRQHIRTYLDDTTRFPTRVTSEVTYTMSSDARKLMDRVLDYARELVRDAEGTPLRRQRIRWWAALAMLRCVSSSPAAAADTLRKRANGLGTSDDLGAGDIDAFGERAVLDLDGTDTTENDDVVPGSDTIEDDPVADRERQRLLAMAREADKLRGANDRKLVAAVEIISQLLKDGFSPIVYCRYIATAEYVADELRKRLKGVHVEAVTGLLPPEEREQRVHALEQESSRVLVATDCLSEGINLQAGFDAVVHYDLSWNPTRHEQREGRVDRFGQRAPEVRTLLLYGGDNPVDGAVLRVLLRKAEDIRKTLGVLVPVPVDTTRVMEAVFESLFLGNRDPRQMALQFDTTDQRLQEVELLWQESAEREQRSRSIFSQLAIKPELVRAELDEARQALGSYQDVERFVRNSMARLGAPLGHDPQGRLLLPVKDLPDAIREAITMPDQQAIGFDLPLPDGVRHIGRTDPLVEALGEYLTGAALDPHLDAPVARCGAMRTAAVGTRTTLLLLRLRMHIDTTRDQQRDTLLAEEAVLVAYKGRGADVTWLDPAAAEALLRAEPARNVPPEQAVQWLRDAVADIDLRWQALGDLAAERAAAVLDAHRRVRDAANWRGSFQVRPVLPPDVLGIYVFMPPGV